MLVTVTMADGQLRGQQVEIVVDKIFAVGYSEVLKCTIIMTVAGASILVQESVEIIRQKMNNPTIK